MKLLFVLLPLDVFQFRLHLPDGRLQYLLPSVRRQDGGVPSQAATSAVSPVAARPESARWAVSLHGDSVLPTRRIASPYTEGLGFLHGGCVGDIGLSLNCCQCCQYPIPIPNWPLATLGLATFSHWQHSPTTCGSRPLSMRVGMRNARPFLLSLLGVWEI